MKHVRYYLKLQFVVFFVRFTLWHIRTECTRIFRWICQNPDHVSNYHYQVCELENDLCLMQYFYSAHNARIASAVLATAIPSVRLSVCLSVCPSVTRRYLSKRRHVVRCRLHRWIAKYVSFFRNQKIFPRDDPFPLKFWLKVTYPLLKAASFDTLCLVAPQP